MTQPDQEMRDYVRSLLPREREVDTDLPEDRQFAQRLFARGNGETTDGETPETDLSAGGRAPKEGGHAAPSPTREADRQFVRDLFQTDPYA